MHRCRRSPSLRWAHVRVLVPLFCTSLLAVGPVPSAAQPDARTAHAQERERSFADAIGSWLMFAAWPTATYERVAYGGTTRVANGSDIRVRLHGTSAFGGGRLWTDVVVMIRDGSVQDLRWGRNNAVIPPGTTIAALGEALLEMNRQYRAGESPGSAARLSVAEAKSPREFRITNRCSDPIRVAVGYWNTSGEWIADGWWHFAPGDGDYLVSGDRRLRSTADSWYYYAESTAGLERVWSGDAEATVRGRTVRMRKVQARDGEYETSLTCGP